jgi:HEAT repeat protein
MYDTTSVFDPETNGYAPVVKNQAYKEAADLADKDCIGPLINLIDEYSSNKTNDKDFRKTVYSILYKIAKNTKDMDVFHYFEERLAEETDKYILSDFLLNPIVRSPYKPSLHSILPFVDHTYWSIRHEAIALLGRFSKEEVEGKLLSILSGDADKYDIEYTLGALANIGSTKVLSVIDPFLHHEKGDVRASAIFTLKVVGGKQYLPVFREGLKDRSPAVKFQSLHAVLKHGDEKDVPLLLTRLKTILKRERKHEPGNLQSSDVVKIIKFLLQHKNKEVIDTLYSINETKQDVLFDIEKEWLLNELQKFKN